MKPAKKTETLLRKLPKADLHCHLDGSLRVPTILELAREAHVLLPADNLRDLKRYVQISSARRSLADFLKVFDMLYPLLRKPQAVERIAYELCEDCARENIRYVEVRLAPLLQASRNFPIEEVVLSVDKGLERGRKDFGVQSGVIICLYRCLTIKENRLQFEVIKSMFGKGVAGMDLAGDEARHSTWDFADFFKEGARRGIPATCHAGETEGMENLKAALSLNVQRIGHGINLMKDENLLREVVERKIPLEIGITSNVRTNTVPSLKAHPVISFFEAGVPVTLNTDDRGILGIDLTYEYMTAFKLGLSLKDLAKVTLTGAGAAFVNPDAKAKMLSQFRNEINALLGEEIWQEGKKEKKGKSQKSLSSLSIN